METIRKTSWNDLQLFNLSYIANHKVVKEYNSFKWYSKPDDTWILQSDKDFESKAKAFEYIHYNLPLWNKELFNRRNVKIGNVITNSSSSIRANDLYDEIKEVRKEFPLLSQKRLAEHFQVSISTIKRALRA